MAFQLTAEEFRNLKWPKVAFPCSSVGRARPVYRGSALATAAQGSSPTHGPLQHVTPRFLLQFPVVAPVLNVHVYVQDKGNWS